MKNAVLVARILLGLAFLFFGLNGILHFKSMPLPTGDAGLFITVMAHHGYMRFVAVLQIVGGLLLLVGRFVPLGLVLLTPIIVNILLFHVLLEPEGLLPGLITAVLDLFLLWGYRKYFAGLFASAHEVS